MTLNAIFTRAHRRVPAAERGSIARTLALMFGAGAALLLFTLLLPGDGPGDRNELALAAIAAVAMIGALALLAFHERTPFRLLALMPALGSLLVGAVICFAGPAAASAYALFFTWVVIAGATYLEPGPTALHGVFAVVVYDTAVRIAGPDTAPSALSLTMLAGTALVASMVLAGLASRARAVRTELEAAARTDPLTGLANRRALRDAFVRELGRADRMGHPLGLIVLDIDHFKRFNDALGHLAGDDALRRLARILDEVTRASELAARIGGEEFAIIAPATDAPGAIALSERLRIAVETEFAAVDPPLTLSFGIAVHRPGDGAADGLFEAADRALYRAKEGGRNRIEVAGRRSAGRFQLPREFDEPVEGVRVRKRVA